MGDHENRADKPPATVGSAVTDGVAAAGGRVDGEERRAALLLAALRLSRDPGMLPRLEGALAPLDDGRRPRAARRAERALLRRLGERLPGTLAPADAAAWEEEARTEAEAGAAEAGRARLGRAGPAAAEPAAAALRAAGALQARLDAGEEVGPGDAAPGGWVAAARLPLAAACRPLHPWVPAELWALLPPERGGGEPSGTGGGAVAFAATGGAGGGAPTAWDWAAVLAEVEGRRAALEAAERFLGEADRARSARQEAAGRRHAGLRRWEAARRAAARVGAAGVLRFLDGRAERAEGAVLLGPRGEASEEGVPARRADPPPPPPTPDRPWAEQVWARPLGDGTWRRGRLAPEADGAPRLVFADEPGAEAPAGPGGEPPPPPRGEGRALERDLLGCRAVRRKAAAPGGAYAALLFAALEGARWRHAAGGGFWAGGQRSAADVVARVAGAGEAGAERLLGAPQGVLDGEVLADLRALGWEREGGGP